MGEVQLRGSGGGMGRERERERMWGGGRRDKSKSDVVANLK